MLAKWLPASANGYLNLVPGVTAAMLVSPGAEFEAEVSFSLSLPLSLSRAHESTGCPATRRPI